MTALAWIALAGVLAAAEIFAPGAILIWFAFGAVMVSLAAWLFPEMLWQVQISIFLIASILSLFGWRMRSASRTDPDPAESMNNLLQNHIGRTGVLTNAISHGEGRVKLGDTTWSVTGPDLPENSAVRIVAIRDGMLVCESAG